MKQCTACNTTYADDSLSYCLADGKPLMQIQDDNATIISRTGEETVVLPVGDRMRVEIPQETVAVSTPPQQYVAAAATKSSGSGWKIFAGFVAVFLLLAVVVIAGGVIFYLSRQGTDVMPKNTAVDRSPTPGPSATKDDKDELREQIANLEKRLNEQKSTNKPANIPLALPNQPNTTATARVNSPSDGFLALRTFPSSDVGSRVLQIPHGASFTVGGCLSPTKMGNKTGRWCRASYNGYSGWVFDAYLVY